MKKQKKVRVGRWMCNEEYIAMERSSRLVESELNGVTNVVYPPGMQGYAAAKPGNLYVEFDVPRSVLKSVSKPPPPWAKIYGPNHLFAQKLGITEMPAVSNVTIIYS